MQVESFASLIRLDVAFSLVNDCRPANSGQNMSASPETQKKLVPGELMLFLVLFFVGLAILPALIYVVGHSLFGEYGGTGFSNFYGLLHSEFRSGQPVVWFLVLSPYIAWQLLRLTILGFRRASRSK